MFILIRDSYLELIFKIDPNKNLAPIILLFLFFLSISSHTLLHLKISPAFPYHYRLRSTGAQFRSMSHRTVIDYDTYFSVSKYLPASDFQSSLISPIFSFLHCDPIVQVSYLSAMHYQ